MFAEILGFTQEELERDRIHDEIPLPPHVLGYMYLSGRGTVGMVNGLHPTYRYLDRMFRKTIDCKGGDKGNIADYSRNLLHRMAPDSRLFSLFDFIWCEIKSVGEKTQRGCGFAPYLMTMIEHVIGHSFDYDCTHRGLRITIDLPETGTPPPALGAAPPPLV